MSVYPPEVIAAAKSAMKATRVPASVTLAQWALESGHGEHTPEGSNNPFGIKALAGQPFVNAMTTEEIHGHRLRVTQAFRKFPTLADAFTEHARLLSTSHWYVTAMSRVVSPMTPTAANAFAEALNWEENGQWRGYATQPHYGDSLVAVMRGSNLYQYDH